MVQVQNKPSGKSLELEQLIEGYRLCAQSEGKSPHTVAIVESSVRYLLQFLHAGDASTAIENIGATQIRAFIMHLQARQRFTSHPYTKPQEGKLSGHTVNGYARALRSFWSWLVREGYTIDNPFVEVRIPKAPKKLMPTFTPAQIAALVSSLDTSTQTGFRDYAIILLLLDTGIRCSELTSLRIDDTNLQALQIRVNGKGSKQRMVPIGARVQQALWKYINVHRPQQVLPRYNHVFLTKEGRPLTKDSLETIIAKRGRRAGIRGIRCSPHTFRHSMAIMYIRNGGDIFSLQRILGHSTLDVLKIYVNMASSDVQDAHRRYSPVDNMELPSVRIRDIRPRR